jgi:hypothetical protein
MHLQHVSHIVQVITVSDDSSLGKSGAWLLVFESTQARNEVAMTLERIAPQAFEFQNDKHALQRITRYVYLR